MKAREIAEQVHALTLREVSNMLVKSVDEILASLMEQRGFVISSQGVVVAYAALYEWQNYYEIGSVVTHPDHRRRGYAEKVAAEAIAAARLLGDKQIIALTNQASTPLFSKLGFEETPKTNGKPELWESCVSDKCPEQCQWPQCHCRLMILSA